MPVKFDNVAPEAAAPQAPRIWLWLALLVLFLILGVASASLFSTSVLQVQSLQLWTDVFGLPLVLWISLGVGRALIYIGQLRAAEGWNQARSEDVRRKECLGRRSFLVFASSTYTALRRHNESSSKQLHSILDGGRVIKTQPCRLQKRPARHSQLPNENVDPELLLMELLMAVLKDLSRVLNELPVDTPVAFLFETDSGLSESSLRRAWREAWRRSGIRQSMEPVPGNGLAALDNWLDQRSNDSALLLVLAFQFALQDPNETAESVVGLLLGNPGQQVHLSPRANLHRPEQALGTSPDALISAAHFALDWASMEVESTKGIWQVGISPPQKAALSMAINKFSVSNLAFRRVHDLDRVLGLPGRTSAWLAISLAVEVIQLGHGSQIIFSGAAPGNNELWSVAVTPASSA